ncbi:TPA: hypothetical protein DIC62_03805 [Candidatus Nomurabacteria bacterium]|nr:hypothetical protein [Candidatus Nomurabacteria bacterium]
MKAKKEIIRFQEGTSVKLTFTFDTPIDSNGKYGKQFCYGVNDDMGHEKVIFATEKLNNILQTIGDLKGRKLEIEKKSTDKGKNYWVISEYGEDITPDDSLVREYLRNFGVKNQTQEDIEDLKMRVYDLERAVKNLNGGKFF